jgi:hypothetical protein
MENASSFLITTFQELFNDLHKAQFGHHVLFVSKVQNITQLARDITWDCWDIISHL